MADPKSRPAPQGKSAQNAPTIRLAHCAGAQGDNILLERNGCSMRGNYPAVLISYFYLKNFLRDRHLYRMRDWSMDSGAFSADNVGAKIDLSEYIDTCLRLTAEDPLLVEVFALDVIGDWRASLKNCEAMWKRGVQAIPCFHKGEPWDALLGIARDYPKIAIGGTVGTHRKEKLDFIGQCFARVWPKKIHGFGVSGEDMVMSYPFHSVDATNWELGPCGFGNWKTYGRMNLPGSDQNLRVEIEWHLKLERKARQRWAKEMALLESQEAAYPGPTVRLSTGSGRATKVLGFNPEDKTP